MSLRNTTFKERRCDFVSFKIIDPTAAAAAFTARPSKHETFSQCWFDVGPSSSTLAQHCTNIGWTSHVSWGGKRQLPARGDIAFFLSRFPPVPARRLKPDPGHWSSRGSRRGIASRPCHLDTSRAPCRITHSDTTPAGDIQCRASPLNNRWAWYYIYSRPQTCKGLYLSKHKTFI